MQLVPCSVGNLFITCPNRELPESENVRLAVAVIKPVIQDIRIGLLSLPDKRFKMPPTKKMDKMVAAKGIEENKRENFND